VRSYVEEPHSGISTDRQEQSVLNMTARESEDAREASLDLVRDHPNRLRYLFRGAEQSSIDQYLPHHDEVQVLIMPIQHAILKLSERTMEVLRRAYELQPDRYEDLVAIRGIGAKAIRALALISDLVYGAAPSWKDPAEYSFAHGGKDGIPFPVDRRTYQKSIEIIENATSSAKAGQKEKTEAIRRLRQYFSNIIDEPSASASR